MARIRHMAVKTADVPRRAARFNGPVEILHELLHARVLPQLQQRPLGATLSTCAHRHEILGGHNPRHDSPVPRDRDGLAGLGLPHELREASLRLDDGHSALHGNHPEWSY